MFTATEWATRVSNIEVIASMSMGRTTIWETRIHHKDKDDKDTVITKYLLCSDLKKAGAIKRANSYTKGEEWLNTEEGKVFAIQSPNWKLF
ncbi:hypothetical protein [Exiguobacterium sp. USCH10]|uniref:hypothetical protein n=1 Tax=Exiguobacterium sp. USCH10 TaxID=3024839 RepID=UPI0030A84BCC